jgi:DNA-binding response OmpR family regulator
MVERAIRVRRGSSKGARAPKNPGRKRLLVAEENFDMGEFVCDFLADHGMEPVGPAPTVEQALMLVADSNVDAALLDVILRGGRNVFPVCESLVARHIPFAFVTGWATAEILETFKGVPVIFKPFQRADFLKMVKALLKES